MTTATSTSTSTATTASNVDETEDITTRSKGIHHNTINNNNNDSSNTNNKDEISGKKKKKELKVNPIMISLSFLYNKIIYPIIYLIQRPSIYIGIITFIAYYDTKALHGTFVYDDAGTIKSNVIVTGKVNVIPELFLRDFWGTPMIEIQSHKSFRPITTLSFYFNWQYALYILKKKTKYSNNNIDEIPAQTILQEMNMYGFHIVNLILHCIVTVLVTEATFYIFHHDHDRQNDQRRTRPKQRNDTTTTTTNATTTTTTTKQQQQQQQKLQLPMIIVGCIFGLHPVHVEAVTNITSRGELFMSFFTLMAFLIYATTLYNYHRHHYNHSNNHSNNNESCPKQQSLSSFPSWSYICGIYIIPWICMILSIFSKEQGATTLLSLIIYDFLTYTSKSSLYHYIVVDLYQSIFGSNININNNINNDKDPSNHPSSRTPNTNPTTTTITTITKTQQQQQPKESSTHVVIDSTIAKERDCTIITQNDNNDNDKNNDININMDRIQQQIQQQQELEQQHRRQMTISFLRRAIILMIETIIVVLYRYWLNGITKPDFIYDQNPAGFAKERITRLLSIPYIYCLYIYDYIYPLYLGPDWSGASIDLITSFYNNNNNIDIRVISVVLLWIFTTICIYLLLFGVSPSLSSQQQQRQQPSLSSITTTSTSMTTNKSNMHYDNNNNNKQVRILLISFWGFLFCPFLLSSNLLVVVGLMKADRVMYLPLMGLALLETLFIMHLFYRKVEEEVVVPSITNSKSQPPSTKPFWKYMKISPWKLIGYVLILGQLTFYTAILHKRNVAWSHSLNLWTAAYNLNPRSKHTMYNCGYELSLQQRYIEAEYVLRPIGNPHVDGPSNTFIYAMVLQNMQRCDIAVDLIDMALQVVEEKRRIGGPRNSVSSLMRTKSNLLVAKGFCTVDVNIHVAGQLFYNAVQSDPTNEYAIEQANKIVQRLEQIQLLEQQQQQIGRI